MASRFALASSVLALTVLAASSASAPTAAGDSVTGSATDCAETFCFITDQLTADARSGPNGENPAGTVVWGFDARMAGHFVFNGQVRCLAVSGNVAIIEVVGLEGRATGRIRVTDGGDGLAQDRFEFVSWLIPDPAPVPPLLPPACSSFPGTPPVPPSVTQSGGGANETGDLTLVDAVPLPTSKDQCKNGGWRNYAVFKNQGDCVSFVATKGKNQPAGG